MDDNETQGTSAVSDAARKAGHAAMSVVLATSLASALSTPPNTDLVTLPEPTPIVQQYEPPVEEEVLPEEDEEAPSKEPFWKKLLRVLKYLLIAVLIVGTIVLGAVKGCTSCTGSLVAPTEESQQDDQG